MPAKPKILQIIPAAPGWRTVYLDHDSDDLLFEDVPAWALVEIVTAPTTDEKHTVVCPLVPADATGWYDVADAANMIGTAGPNTTDMELEAMREQAASKKKT